MRKDSVRRQMLTLSAGGLLLLGAGADQSQGPRVTRSTHATVDDKAPSRTYTAPSLLIHPDDPLTAVGAVVEMRARTCHLLRTRDGGLTWTLLDASPSPEGYPFCFNTSGTTTITPVAWGRDATMYYGLSGWGTDDETPAPGARGGGHAGSRGNMSVLVARSTDLGDSWQTAVARDARGLRGEEVENNRPVSSLAVDTNSGSQDIVHVGYVRRLPQADPEVPSTPMVATSTDGGRTFGEPVPILAGYGPQTGPDIVGGRPPQLAVDDVGTLYALTTASPEETDNLLVLARSTDRGKTFEHLDLGQVSGSFDYPIMTWSGEEAGILHLVYEDEVDGQLGDRDIFYRQSTDGGETFSEPQRLNDDDPEQAFGQFNANVTVAPGGRIDVAWWDFRNEPGVFANDVYYAYSTDNGATWSDNVRVSDHSIPRTIGTWSNGFDMRQPPGIASTDSYTLFGWDDTRLGDNVGQAQDVFAAAVQFDPVVARDDGALLAAIAVLGGLAVGGLVLLVIALRLRPSRGDAVPAERPKVGAGV